MMKKELWFLIRYYRIMWSESGPEYKENHMDDLSGCKKCLERFKFDDHIIYSSSYSLAGFRIRFLAKSGSGALYLERKEIK